MPSALAYQHQSEIELAKTVVRLRDHAKSIKKSGAPKEECARAVDEMRKAKKELDHKRASGDVLETRVVSAPPARAVQSSASISGGDGIGIGIGGGGGAKQPGSVAKSDPAPAGVPAPTAHCSTTVAKSGDCRGEHVRGYKVRADGSKTTYFNNDLSEADKVLIGDTAPQRIDAVPPPPSPSSGAALAPAGTGAGAKGGASDWNFAGSYEEKDRTKWAKEQLSKAVAKGRAEVAGIELRVQDVEDIEGDASIAVVKGHVRRIASFEFKVRWVALETGNATPLASGILFADFTSDQLDDVEWERRGFTKIEDPSKRKLVDDGVKDLVAAVQDALASFVARFHEM